MKNAREPERRRMFTLGQWRRRVPGIKRRCGRQHDASAPSAALPERVRLGYASGAILSLLLLLFAVLGMLAVITGASARTPHQLSVSSAAARPTKTPPPRHSPTPTTVPSPTLTAPPTARATAPASVAPFAKARTPSASGKPRGSQTPVATPSTGGPAVQRPSPVQQKERGALVLGILSGIAAVVLLAAVGRWLLRKWLLPVRRVKLPPSGAAPWQRVRPTSHVGPK